MVALPLFDMVLSSTTQAGHSAEVAAQLTRSALDDLKLIETLDEGLASDDPYQFDRQTADLIREMYVRWAQDAELLLERVDRVEEQVGAVPNAQPLRDAHGRTRAMLSVSLEQLEKGLDDILQGRTVPIGEVRRELHLRVR